jgi:hypothetical protein
MCPIPKTRWLAGVHVEESFKTSSLVMKLNWLPESNKALPVTEFAAFVFDTKIDAVANRELEESAFILPVQFKAALIKYSFCLISNFSIEFSREQNEKKDLHADVVSGFGSFELASSSLGFSDL